MTASINDKIYRMLMLLRTYRLIRLIYKIVGEKYDEPTRKERDLPTSFLTPTEIELRKRFKVYTKKESIRDKVFDRTLDYALENEYARSVRKGSGPNMHHIKYTSVNGERLLEGYAYFGYFKELFRVNNFFVTLMISVISLLISIATSIYTLSK